MMAFGYVTQRLYISPYASERILVQRIVGKEMRRRRRRHQFRYECGRGDEDDLLGKRRLTMWMCANIICVCMQISSALNSLNSDPYMHAYVSCVTCDRACCAHLDCNTASGLRVLLRCLRYLQQSTRIICIFGCVISSRPGPFASCIMIICTLSPPKLQVFFVSLARCVLMSWFQRSVFWIVDKTSCCWVQIAMCAA